MSETLNAFDKALHDEIHKQMSETGPERLLENPRIRVLDMLHGFSIKGDVADVGCGSGYFGIAVALNFDSVTRVDCIEASRIAVDSVIPRNIAHYNLSEKVQALEGSYDALPANTYDVVFAMGALHHSRNLGSTMRSIFHSLKSGGLLIAQEPAMPDTTSHDAYYEKYNIIEEKFGLRIRNGDRYDRFFRECEYKYFLVNNGFDICLWKDFETLGNWSSRVDQLVQYVKVNGLKSVPSKLISRLKRKSGGPRQLQEPPWVVQMDIATKSVGKKLFVARKSGAPDFYHRDS